jgi:hypothetical protein
MSLPARKSDLNTVIADLKAMVVQCDADLQAGDPDSNEIARLREQASGALTQLGFNDRTEPV